ASAIIDNDQTDTLTVTPSNGTTPYHYQWYQGPTGTTTTPVGTDSNSFTTPFLSSTTQYWVQVTDSAHGTVNSATATITVSPALAITMQPASFSVDSGQSDTLSVGISGGTPGFSYQWFIVSGGSSTPIPFATLPTFIATPSTTTVYQVVVMDSANGSAG